VGRVVVPADHFDHVARLPGPGHSPPLWLNLMIFEMSCMITSTVFMDTDHDCSFQFQLNLSNFEVSCRILSSGFTGTQLTAELNSE